MLVICPTRSRPERAADLIKSFEDTVAFEADVMLSLVLDSEDPRLSEYRSLLADNLLTHHGVWEGNMVERTNAAVARGLRDWEPGDWPPILGWCADDNYFVTDGWDLRVFEAFENGAGFVNTNDGLVGNDKGGVWFVKTSIVKSLGWLLLPYCEHLYVDFAATELAKAAGVLTYLPDVLIEHRHPYAGKAQWDEQYLSYNNQRQDEKDRTAYYTWRNGPGFTDAVRRVKACVS